MGLRDWVSEKVPGGRETLPFQGPPSMGLRDWVSEKANTGRSPGADLDKPSMGLRDWVSEKGSSPRWRRRAWRSFNGAPRLGLGEGRRRPLGRDREGAPSMGLRDWVSEKDNKNMTVEITVMHLQWGSETGSRRRRRKVVRPTGVPLPSMGLRDWVSEKVSPRRDTLDRVAATFNGAPRLGLGEGTEIATRPPRSPSPLQWGSETGSRRRC